MTYEDLKVFKEKVVDPRMAEIFANVELKDGQTFIDEINVVYSDGRSYGFDILFIAEGYTFNNGELEKYHEEIADISVSDFINHINDFSVMKDGKFIVEDEQQPISIQTEIRNSVDCSKFFEDLAELKNIKFEANELVYQKIQYLMAKMPE